MRRAAWRISKKKINKKLKDYWKIEVIFIEKHRKISEEYRLLYSSMTDAIEALENVTRVLKEVQKKTEEMYINGDEGDEDDDEDEDENDE